MFQAIARKEVFAWQIAQAMKQALPRPWGRRRSRASDSLSTSARAAARFLVCLSTLQRAAALLGRKVREPLDRKHPMKV